jgi:hypothetical protein
MPLGSEILTSLILPIAAEREAHGHPRNGTASIDAGLVPDARHLLYQQTGVGAELISERRVRPAEVNAVSTDRNIWTAEPTTGLAVKVVRLVFLFLAELLGRGARPRRFIRRVFEGSRWHLRPALSGWVWRPIVGRRRRYVRLGTDRNRVGRSTTVGSGILTRLTMTEPTRPP